MTQTDETFSMKAIRILKRIWNGEPEAPKRYVPLKGQIIMKTGMALPVKQPAMTQTPQE